MRDIQEWRKKGNCSGIDDKEADNKFFLGQGGSPKRTREEYCDWCPVKRACLEYAVLYDEVGIWGGTTDKERRVVAPFLKPRLKAEALEAEQLEERRLEPIVPRPSYSGPTEFQLPEDILFDMYLNTLPQTGS